MASPRITIRQATVEDLPWLRFLFDHAMSAIPDHYPAFDAEELDAFTLGVYRGLAQTPRFAAWLAWRGKTAIGSFGGEVQERLVGKPHLFANVLWTYVEPDYRGKDIGFRLMEAFAGWAQEKGVTILECQVGTATPPHLHPLGYPAVATRYAAPLHEVLDKWRGHAYPIPAPPQVVAPNGHDTDAVSP